MNIEYHPEARVEALEQARYYSKNGNRLGPEFLAALKHAGQAVVAHPGRYQLMVPGTRVFRMKRFPIHLYYLHHPVKDSVIVYAVAHTKRRPGYWYSRLNDEP